MPRKFHTRQSPGQKRTTDETDILYYPNGCGQYDGVSEETSPIFNRSTTLYETSLRDEGVDQYEVVGPFTYNAAGAQKEEPAHDVTVESSLIRESTDLKRRDIVGKFVQSYSSFLSTYSNIETEGDAVVAKCRPIHSNFQTLMNLVRGTTGAGILSLPLAFKDAGLWVGFVLLLVIAAVSVHCNHILNRSSDMMEKRSRVHLQSYPEVIEYTFLYGPQRFQRFAPFMRRFSIALVQLMHCSTCCIFIPWVAINIKQVLDSFWPASPDVRVYEVVVFLLLLPYIMVRSLRTLAIFSAVANLIYIVGLVIIFQYLFQDLPDWTKLPAFNSWVTLPSFFGQTLFAFQSSTLVTPLRNKIKRQEDFGSWTGVLNLGLVTISAVYAAIGFYGYLKFGEDAAATVTLNLPQDQWLYLSVTLLFSFSIFLSTGVQFYIPFNVIWPAINRKLAHDRTDKFRLMAQMTTRAGLLTIIFVVAILVPHVDLLMSLVGSFCGSLLSMIIPSVVDLIILYEERRLTIITAAKDAFIFLIGVVGLATGSYSALVDIINTF